MLSGPGFPVVLEPAAEPRGQTEMQIEDPDGIRIILVEVPAGHPSQPTAPDHWHGHHS